MGNKKRAAAAAAVAAAAVAGMVTGAVIDDPTDLLADPDPVVSAMLEDDDGDAAPEERQRGPAARLRAWLLSLPAAVRMLVVLPLWGLGWMLLTALSTFWAGAMTPLLARVLSWLCLAVLLAAVFAAGVKAAFPDLPLREILRPRNVLFLLGMTLVLAVADAVLPTVWTGYEIIQQTVWRVGAACLLAFVCGAALKRQGRRCAARAAAEVPVAPRRTAAEVPVAPRRTAVEEEARRLADTVCGGWE